MNFLENLDNILKNEEIYRGNNTNDDLLEIQEISTKYTLVENNNETYYNFNKNNFILSQGAKERLNKIELYIKNDIPLILEGPTGTSKTISVEKLFEKEKKTLIRINLSQETTIDDLLGKVVNDPKSWGSFSFQKGDYTKAFEKGYGILFDEINLCSENVLQCIEDSLDRGCIYLNSPGVESQMIKKHSNFRIIATQNPNKDNFQSKRTKLSKKFLSRFITIEFPQLNDNELYDISINISHKLHQKYQISEEKIKNLISFHSKWSKKRKNSQDIFDFTLRDILSSLKLMNSDDLYYPSIYLNYISRYPKNIKDEAIQIFKKINHSFQVTQNFNLIPSDFIEKNPSFFSNDSILNVIYLSLLALKKPGHILLTGKSGNGLTFVSKLIGKYFSDRFKLLLCTSETSVHDIFGKYVPTSDFQKSNELIYWKDGPVIKSMKEGNPIILDRVHEVPGQVIEKMNQLLDIDLSQKNPVFYLNENPTNPTINIKNNFRIITTCYDEEINKLSPAFLNRFTIINMDKQILNLEDQINFCKYSLSNENIDMNIFIKVLKSNEMKMGSISLLSEFLDSFKLLRKYLDGCKIDEILDLMLKIYNIDEFNISENIQKKLLEYFQNENEKKFYYSGSLELSKTFSLMIACYICKKNIVLVGPTGIGKTEAAKFFASSINPILFKNNSKSNSFFIQSFHSETKVDDIYGTYTIKDGDFIINNGPLWQSMENGNIYIADELNLAEESLLKTMSLVFEREYKSDCILPGIGEEFRMNQNFFFIGCQNQIGLLGRNSLPDQIRKN